MNLILKYYVETLMMKIFDIHIAISFSYMYDLIHIFFLFLSSLLIAYSFKQKKEKTFFLEKNRK